jgi:hypothetical protein
MFEIVRSLSLHRSMREREGVTALLVGREQRREEERCVAECCFGDKKTDKGEGERGADDLP